MTFISNEASLAFFITQEMTPPKIEESTKEERLAYVRQAWQCMHNCEICGKCSILRGRDPEIIYSPYINGEQTYMEITLKLRDRSL